MQNNVNTIVTHAENAAKWLKALSNPHRLMLVCLLYSKEYSVSELNAKVPLSQSALSQHLAILRAEKLVTTRKNAQNVYYALKNDDAKQIIAILQQRYCAV